jgi:hypothetical protein
LVFLCDLKELRTQSTAVLPVPPRPAQHLLSFQKHGGKLRAQRRLLSDVLVCLGLGLSRVL